VWQYTCKSEKFRLAEFLLCLMSIMPPSQAALRRALVRAMAFAHHKAQEKIEKRPHREIDGPEKSRPERDRANQNEERCGGE
jgi:flagellar biosynthesis component FlhA